jgi:hypothetical protein
MKKILFYLLSATCLGCNGYQYISNPTFIPLHEQKGETKAVVAINNFHIAHSFTKHLGFVASVHLRARMIDMSLDRMQYKESGGGQIIKDKSQNFSLGLNYFRKTGKISFFETQGGIGVGNVYYENYIDCMSDDYRYTLQGQKQMVYLQPTFALKPMKPLEIGLFTKFSGIKYYNLNDTLNNNSSYPEKQEIDHYFYSRKSANFVFAEPGGFLRVGSEKLKFQVMFSFPILLNDQDLYYRPANVYMGLAIKF